MNLQDAIGREVEKRTSLEERVADIPLVRELRDLGVGNALVAKSLDISPSTSAFYMTGTKPLPVKYIPRLMDVLNTAIQSWRQLISEWKAQPMSEDWAWRVNHYADIVDHCEEQLNLYRRVWDRGPERKR